MSQSEPNLHSQVVAVIRDELELDVPAERLVPECVLYGPPIRLDSLGYLRLIIGLERAFGFRVPEVERSRVMLETVEDVVRWVREHR